ncbi:hypothetical protein WOLCODRAFT_15127 [Wolfiporia cocos MD-104 SS10]|uniref:DRBM domain-containing protein n=1 Tax=Wolfiporia cocos (strain MD-104) TaxID=742152 RepID=A0A2H3IVW3_WOLCO|nr:hypothetical protein WOLCODRAFT_15127 [Wolfiporia cocos MD-104 SS10]
MRLEGKHRFIQCVRDALSSLSIEINTRRRQMVLGFGPPPGTDQDILYQDIVTLQVEFAHKHGRLDGVRRPVISGELKAALKPNAMHSWSIYLWVKRDQENSKRNRCRLTSAQSKSKQFSITELEKYLGKSLGTRALRWEVTQQQGTADWVAVAYIHGCKYGQGEGVSKQIAKDIAAAEALKTLETDLHEKVEILAQEKERKIQTARRRHTYDIGYLIIVLRCNYH